MKQRWGIFLVIGLGLAVTASTALQGLQNDASQLEWRPYVIVGAVLTGLVAVLNLAASMVLNRPTVPGPPAQALSSTDPRRIGDYQIVGKLGAGAMGRAYLGVTKSGEFVSVKIIRPEFAESTEFRRRFAREVTSIGKVRSPYTTQLIDADAQAEQPWMATSYIAGVSLQQAIETDGAWPADKVWKLGEGIGQALQAVHAAGVVHRDLKPANILLAPDGPRVIDFGIARAADASALTGTMNRPGTPAFMAPEQALGQAVGPAVDVFALGVVLAYAATGRIPFGEGSSDAVLFRVVHQPPDLTGVDGDLRALIEQCLDKNPGRRPTPQQIVERGHGQLRPAADWLPPTIATQVGQAAAVAAQAGRQAAQSAPSRRRFTAVAAGLALVTALASVALQVTPGLAGWFGDQASPTAAPMLSSSALPSASASASPTPAMSPSPSRSPTRSPRPPSPTPSATAQVPTVVMPNVLGGNCAAEITRLSSLGLVVRVLGVTDAENCEIIDQNPEPNTLVAEGQTVEITGQYSGSPSPSA